MLLGLLEGYDLLIVLGIIALLFGGSQLPKLARSLGSASHEFRRGVDEGHRERGGEDGKPAATEVKGSAGQSG
ncbi:MAG TPA: twin-arginine translocase TatA/TatE family subunit [Acidimicrobiales bacterium]|jgi:sec-independent protein translocase protein TatA|nr:twin-arginine translocase TatA/TatE family subunit [Acidimicrobiales bacterium]